VSERPYDRAANAALIQLSAIAGYGRGRGVLELRHRTPTPGSRMRRRFVDVDDVDQAVILARRLAVTDDVYIGCALRHNARGGGTRNDLAAAWVLWADCDGAQAAQRLTRFDPPAAITLASGNIRSRLAWSRSASGVGRWRHVADVAGYSGRRGRGCAMARAEGGRS